MGKFIDLTGERFGRLLVLCFIPRRAWRRSEARWLCLCECGNKTIVPGYDLRVGHTTSCGCLAKELTSIRARTHGKSDTKLYSIWLGMIKRCSDENSVGWEYYGGKGVTICSEWRKFSNFNKWAEKEYSPGLFIDRRDNDKGYSPGNCRFVTSEINNTNKGVFKKNKLGITGVYMRGLKFYAAIQSMRAPLYGKLKHLGSFNTQEGAMMARNNFIIANNLPHKIQELKNA